MYLETAQNAQRKITISLRIHKKASYITMTGASFSVCFSLLLMFLTSIVTILISVILDLPILLLP